MVQYEATLVSELARFQAKAQEGAARAAGLSEEDCDWLARTCQVGAAPALLHLCTAMLMYRCTDMLLYRCTDMLMYRCTDTLLTTTAMLLYRCTAMLLYRCTVAAVLLY